MEILGPIGWLIIGLALIKHGYNLRERAKTNLNDFAKDIVLAEGKKKSLSIAQVKEVVKLTFTKLATLDDQQIVGIIKRYR